MTESQVVSGNKVRRVKVNTEEAIVKDRRIELYQEAKKRGFTDSELKNLNKESILELLQLDKEIDNG